MTDFSPMVLRTFGPWEPDWSDAAPSLASWALRSSVETVCEDVLEQLEEYAREHGVHLDWGDPDDEDSMMDPSIEVVMALVSLEMIRRSLALEMSILIGQGLALGLSWQQMASVTGTSKQALHKRHADRVKQAVNAVLKRDGVELEDLAHASGMQPDLEPLMTLVRRVQRRQR